MTLNDYKNHIRRYMRDKGCRVLEETKSGATFVLAKANAQFNIEVVYIPRRGYADIGGVGVKSIGVCARYPGPVTHRFAKYCDIAISDMEGVLLNDCIFFVSEYNFYDRGKSARNIELRQIQDAKGLAEEGIRMSYSPASPTPEETAKQVDRLRPRIYADNGDK